MSFITKIALTIGAAALVLGALALDANAGPIKDQMLNPVVKINDNCSAVSIDIPNPDNKANFITAKHCVGSDSEGYLEQVTLDGTKVVKTEKFFFDVERRSIGDGDLALLEVRDPNFKIAKATVAKKMVVEEGERVWAVGYPLAMTRTITEGLYNGIQVLDASPVADKAYAFTRASPNIDGGNSGGGLFQKNGENYELIGVTSMKVGANEFMNFFIPIEDIREFLNLKAEEVDEPASTDGADVKPLKFHKYGIDLR